MRLGFRTGCRLGSAGPARPPDTCSRPRAATVQRWLWGCVPILAAFAAFFDRQTGLPCSHGPNHGLGSWPRRCSDEGLLACFAGLAIVSACCRGRPRCNLRARARANPGAAGPILPPCLCDLDFARARARSATEFKRRPEPPGCPLAAGRGVAGHGLGQFCLRRKQRSGRGRSDFQSLACTL